MVFLKARQVLGQERRQGAIADDAAGASSAVSPLTFIVKDIDGKEYDLAQLKGKVVMIVNVASKCGLTKQYTGLQGLYEKYKDQGLVIVGFPANNFSGQEPGTEEEIKAVLLEQVQRDVPDDEQDQREGRGPAPAVRPAHAQDAGRIPRRDRVELRQVPRRPQRPGLRRFASKTTPEDEALVAAVEKALGAAKAAAG